MLGFLDEHQIEELKFISKMRFDYEEKDESESLVFSETALLSNQMKSLWLVYDTWRRILAETWVLKLNCAAFE